MTDFGDVFILNDFGVTLNVTTDLLICEWVLNGDGDCITGADIDGDEDDIPTSPLLAGVSENKFPSSSSSIVSEPLPISNLSS